MLTPFYSSENDIILARIQRELGKLFARGIPEWKDRQDSAIDNILSGIHGRTKNPIDTVEKLDDYINGVYEKYNHKFSLQGLIATGWHKFINTQGELGFVLLCCEHPRVTREEYKKNRSVDFWIDNEIPIDLKVTPYPKKLKPGELKLKESLNRDSADKLIKRLYKEQGLNDRWNWQNRLFIICYDADKGNHLELKGDFDRMREVVTKYFDNFKIGQMHSICQLEVNGFVREMDFKGRSVQPVALSDIIWNYREKPFSSNALKVDPIIGAEQLGLF